MTKKKGRYRRDGQAGIFFNPTAFGRWTYFRGRLKISKLAIKQIITLIKFCHIPSQNEKQYPNDFALIYALFAKWRHLCSWRQHRRWHHIARSIIDRDVRREKRPYVNNTHKNTKIQFCWDAHENDEFSDRRYVGVAVMTHQGVHRIGYRRRRVDAVSSQLYTGRCNTKYTLFRINFTKNSKFAGAGEVLSRV